MTSMLSQNHTSHKDLLRQRTEQIDRLNEQIREFSATQKAELQRLQESQTRLRIRGERQARLANLARFCDEKCAGLSPVELQQLDNQGLELGSADSTLVPDDLASILPSLPSPDEPLSPDQQQQLSSALGPLSVLRARAQAYAANNARTREQAEELKGRSSELEYLYRRVVSLCTGVAEDKVEEALPNLVAAIESERGGMEGEGDVGRVRDFLRRVDGGQSVRVDG